MSKLPPIAHAARDSDDDWRSPHDLADHLMSVGSLAETFAASFGPDWARQAGRWHDLGKYRQRFQSYIRQQSGFDVENAHITGEAANRAPHSTAGAVLSCDQFGLAGRVLAYLIAGHHAGLADWFGGLQVRLDQPEARAELDEALAESPPMKILDTANFKPDLRQIPGGKNGFSLWVRMLFSALVDADFLDTEAYMSPDKSARREKWLTLPALAERFDQHMAKLSAHAKPSDVNAIRTDVLKQCRDAASHDPGLFTLTVPTGGGKTLSSMAFALDHAKSFGKRRIIHVIPYTSIIEQTADIFRGIFGDAVIEHHSNAESDPKDETAASRLACENWDAPIIVTTSVQFFESLFASRTSRCRKLHNLVNSVVILDEAQLLPPDFLQPILDGLNLLTEHYGVTVVLSTATQPALASAEYFDKRKNLRGLRNVREIISNPEALYRTLQRVTVHLPDDWNAPSTWEDIATRMMRHDSALAIVNRRQDARELWQALPKETLHLSALMCGAHRSSMIREIKTRLADGIPTRVVSTQLVEAGVDVDFPVVYRAMAGLDSIAQAAGRCNREGRLEKGEVFVFMPPKASPVGLLRKGEDASRSVLASGSLNPLDRMAFQRYFQQLYQACELDIAGVCQLLTVEPETLAVNFRAAAEKFRLISDDDSSPVVVDYHAADTDETIDSLLNILRRDGPQRWLMRKLQRYTVNLHARQIEQLNRQGDIKELIPGLFVQHSDWLYDLQLGLNPDGRPNLPAAGIV